MQIEKYEKEKSKLIAEVELDAEKSEKFQPYIQKLENEIQSFKNITANCKQNCQELTKEILNLQKQLKIYTHSKYKLK